jgi:hypothetical protein
MTELRGARRTLRRRPEHGTPGELPACVESVLARGPLVRSEVLSAPDDYWSEIRRTLAEVDAKKVSTFDGFSDDEAQRCIARSTRHPRSHPRAFAPSSSAIPRRPGDPLMERHQVSGNCSRVASISRSNMRLKSSTSRAAPRAMSCSNVSSPSAERACASSSWWSSSHR